MEHRIGKIIIGATGGTAAKGAKTYKVSLPTAWIQELGISSEQRDVELSFDGNSIVISPKITGEEFAAKKLALGHDVRCIRFFDSSELCSTIYADFTEQKVMVENQAVLPVKTAFGRNLLPTWDDFNRFLQERCIPRERAGLREYLEAIGVDEYDPLRIIQKTSGKMAEDHQWLEVEVMT